MPEDLIHHLPPAVPTAYGLDNLPFDAELLDDLMDQAGLDALLLTSKHNVQYMLGGYSFIFFSYKEAIGLSRYIPVFVYIKGRPEATGYFGNALEVFGAECGVFWTPHTQTGAWGTVDAVQVGAQHIEKILGDSVRVGIEYPFLPFDSGMGLKNALPNADLVEAFGVMEQLRRIKSPAELALLKLGSEAVVQSMQAVFHEMMPGQTKADLVEMLRREETNRGLIFEYCLVTAGTDLNRAVSDQVIEDGDIVSLDSGGNLRGWVGDLCRMGILGAPDAELEDILAGVDEIQQAARAEIRPGADSDAVFAAAHKAASRWTHRAPVDFLAHGMGLVSHEAPRMTGTGPVPYPKDAGLLKPGMVISVETAIRHPSRGYVKLEDTVAITEKGCEGFGDAARGWNVAGYVA